MADHVMRKNQVEIKSLKRSEVGSTYNLHQSKFDAATKRAEELLSQPGPLTIYDSLNCGKFNAKFVKEMLFILKSLFGLNSK